MDLRSWLSALGVAPAGGTAYGMAAPPMQSPQPMGLAVPPMARGTKLSAEMSYDGSHPRQQEQAARDHFRSYGPQTLADAFIPGYGAGGDAKAASEAYGEGRYGAAAGNALMAAMDFVPVLGALAAIPGAARKAMTVKAYRGGNDGNWFSSSQEVARRYAADRGVDRVQEQSLTFENPLVIDGNGSNWVSIGGAPLYEVFDAAGKFKGYRTKSAGLSDMGEGAYFGAKSGMYEGGRTTEEIVKEARQKGHDGVVFKNIADNPDGGVDRGLSDTIVAIPENAQNSTAAAKGIRAASNAPSSRGYDDVADWLHSYLGSRTGKSEEDLRAQIRRVIQRANEPPHFGNFRPIDEAVADQVPIVTKGKSFVLSQRGRGPARPKINASPEPIGRSPGAMWGALDTQDYREDVRAGEVIENLYVDLETIPKERLAGGVTGYDWSDLQRAREIPPITLRQNKNGSLSIIDGNHRLRWARENGFDSVPAYVIRPQDGMNTGAQ